MAEINVTLSQIDSQNINTVKYNEEDIELLNGNIIIKQFGLSNDYIEQVLYDSVNNLININYNYLNQQVQQSFISPNNTTSEVTINPETDLQQLGYTSGEFKLLYNFFRKKIGNGLDNPFFIKEI
jgi:replication initiation and membrane attachment protein DnaB